MARKKKTETANPEIMDEQNAVTETTEQLDARNMGILKINIDDDSREYINEDESSWIEIMNAYRVKREIPVLISGIEKTSLGGDVVVGYYKTKRIIIPMNEMMIMLNDDARAGGRTNAENLNRVCNTMLGAEIDVIIKGIDKQGDSIVASRKDAMLKKRKKYYLTPLSDGLPQIREGRIVEARVIGVTASRARLEIFGVEIALSAANLSWDWVGDVSEHVHVGEKINVLIKKIEGEDINNIKIEVSIKEIIKNISAENLSKCVVQGKYIGEITNIHNGTVYIRLKIGVNAIANANYDKHTPGKGDIVSFVITRINPDYNNVSGIISRIIKQNI